MNSIGRSILMGVVIGITIVLVFAGGFFFREIIDAPARVRAASEDETYSLLDEVQALLDAHFVRPQPDYTQRQYAAVRGMLESLQDPFTFFIDPPVAASESDVLSGTYGGIGVQIQRSETGDLLLYPFAESPALAVGIGEGDILRAVNGQPVDVNLPADALDQLLRGEVLEGSGVEVTVEKVVDSTTITVFVPFAVINVPSVVWRVLPDDATIGYIQVLRFTARTPDEVRTGLGELQNSGIASLVLDLRDNTGGLLQESITVADEFIDEGVLVYERDANGETSFNSSGGGLGGDIPLVVLVNDYTASGAEIVAGAIQDSGRAMLIGQRTYGKGTVQQIYPLSDSSSLHVTASEWFTPAHQPLQGEGLVPNVEMIPDANGRDVELGEAIRQLQAMMTASRATTQVAG